MTDAKTVKCDTCGGPTTRRIMDLEVASLGKVMRVPIIDCPKCSENADNGVAQQAEREKRKIDESIRDSIPERYIEARCMDFGSDIKPILDWIKNPDGFLFIHGVCGTGKTHLSCAITMDFRRKGRASKLFKGSSIFLELRRSFGSNTGNGEMDIINRCCGKRTGVMTVNEYQSGPKEKAVHIFDDVGAQKLSDYVVEAWYDIIDYRYAECLPTIFSSNLSLKEVSLAMSDRIASRMASGKVVELKGNDRRLSK